MSLATRSWAGATLLCMLAVSVVAVSQNVPAGYANAVCYENTCFSLFPTPHCAECCATNTCKDNSWSCDVCDCRPACTYGKSHCVPANGQTNSSQKWPVAIPGRCCKAGKVGFNCSDCGAGYYGPDCTRCPGAFEQPCSNHGTCDGSGTHGGTGKCSCSHGWLGDDCSQCNTTLWDCPGKKDGSVCSGHGTCKCTGSLRNETMCECSTRFAGPDCSVCNTQYRNLNGSTDCSYCAEGYFGNDPSPGEALVCSPCPFCPGHGVCDGSGTTKGSYTCHCVDGYEGATCSSTPTNWLIVGPILGGVGLLLGLCIGWRVCVCRRQAKAERLHQLKQALLQQEQQEERKRRKKEKKRAKKQRKREERQRRRRKKKRRARQGASGNPGERLPPSTASVDDDGGDGSSSDDNDDGGDVAVEMNGSNGQLGAVPGPVTGGWETTNSGTGYYVPPQPRIVHNEALADNAVV